MNRQQPETILVISSTICSCNAADEAASIRHFTIEVFDSILHVPEFQWNNQIPESNYLMQHNQLHLIETVQANQMQFRYVLIKNNGITAGVAYFQLVLFHADQLINYFPASGEKNLFMKMLKSFSEKLLEAINVKLLVSGNVFMTGENGYYFSNDIDKATRAKIIRNTVRQILSGDSSIKAVLISDLYHPKSSFDEGFTKCGYNEIYVESDMSIRLREEWKTFDDYLGSLSSKYRVRARKVFALCHDHEVTMKELNAEGIKLHEDRIFELYHKVIAGADFKLAELSKSFFYAQKVSLPRQYHLFAYFKNGKILGFISLFHLGKRMEVHYTGMDADVSRPIHLYQHMMYDMIKFGIENGASQMHFGRTAPEIKSTIGAVPSPMYGYLKHRNPFFNLLVARPYTANLKPRDYIFRHPFKD